MRVFFFFFFFFLGGGEGGGNVWCGGGGSMVATFVLIMCCKQSLFVNSVISFNSFSSNISLQQSSLNISPSTYPFTSLPPPPPPPPVPIIEKLKMIFNYSSKRSYCDQVQKTRLRVKNHNELHQWLTTK